MRLTVRLDVVNPNISQSVIVGVTCVIIVLLFAIQPLGTAKVASTFAPVIIVWFLFNLSFGIYVSFVRFCLPCLPAELGKTRLYCP